MRHPPSIKQLEAFLAIEALRNVTTAAAKLCVSQPALSRTLRMMEDALGAPLFRRTTRAIELTSAGRALLPVAKRLVGEYNECFGDLEAVLEGNAGRVVVAGLPSVTVAFIPKVLSHPGISGQKIEAKVLGLVEQQVMAAVRDGTADFGIVTEPAPADWFVFTRLLVDEYVLVCRRDDPLARRKVVPWTVLRSRPFVGLTHASSVRPTLERTFIALGMAVNVRYEVDHLSLVGAIVASGLALTVLPRLSLALIDCSDLVSIRLKAPAVDRVIGIIQRSDAPLSSAAARLRHALLAEAGAR